MNMSLVLAQLPGVNQPEVSRLAAPPPIPHYLFENPWPVAVILLAAATIAFYLLNRKGRARQAVLAGAVLAVLAALVVLLATLLTTTREALTDHTKSLIDATARADIARLGPMLAADCSATLYGPTAGNPFGKDVILSLVEKYLGGPYRVSEFSTSNHQALAPTDRTGQTQTRVRVVVDGIPNGSWWRIRWRKDSDAADDALGGWRVTSIECILIDGVGDPAAHAR